jgi:uncharacterized coiled-coil protein SlyX
MPEEISNIPAMPSADLEISLVELTAALIEHAKHLERHINTMESLTRALKQLDASIKREVNLESSQPSIELREAITSFLDHNINPKFYQDSGYLKLAAPDAKPREAGRKSKHPKAQ